MPSEQLEQVIAFIRAGAASSDELATHEESRVRMDETGAMFSVPDDVTILSVELGGVPCERFVPEVTAGDAGATIVYLHGGAYTAGSLASHRAFAARLAQACRRAVLAVDYRLAPEHRFPAGLDDARSVYLALLDSGLAPEQVFVAGDSAGGGLAAALLLRLRDERGPLPAGGVLLSPWLDLTLTSDAISDRAGEDPLLRADSLARSADAYADDLRHPLVSPVYADAAGLPPLLILVGTAEILLDDSRTFAQHIRDGAGSVDLDIEDDLIHVWPYIAGVPEAEVALERVAGWVDQHSDKRSAELAS